jgi:PEGA domain
VPERLFTAFPPSSEESPGFPSAAEIYLGDTPLGATPATIDLPAGTYALELKPLNGGAPSAVNVTITTGSTDLVVVTLQPAPASASLRAIRTSPRRRPARRDNALIRWARTETTLLGSRTEPPRSLIENVAPGSPGCSLDSVGPGGKRSRPRAA